MTNENNTAIAIDVGKIKCNFVRDVICFEQVVSTNDVARSMIVQDGRPALIVARQQSQGRGRNGSVWLNTSGALMFSMLLYPRIDLTRLAPLTLLTGLCVYETLRECGCANATIKWPNDVLVDGKKVCGILTESSRGACVVGVGINVNGDSVPLALADIATSMRIQCGKVFELYSVLNTFLEIFDTRYAAFLSGAEFIGEYKKHCSSIGNHVSITRGDVVTSGTGVDVDADGRLIVRTQNGDCAVI